MLVYSCLFEYKVSSESRKVSSFHCVESIQIRTFFWSVFSRTRAEYGYLLRKSPYSVRIRENTDQKKLRIWTIFTQCLLFSRYPMVRMSLLDHSILFSFCWWTILTDFQKTFKLHMNRFFILHFLYCTFKIYTVAI